MPTTDSTRTCRNESPVTTLTAPWWTVIRTTLSAAAQFDKSTGSVSWCG